MKQQISKLLVPILAITFAAIASASAQETAGCVASADFEAVGKNFQQISNLVKPGKAEYCEADLGREWYQIARSLVTLKNMKPNEPLENKDDAFTYKAINAPNWWEYFIARANMLSIVTVCPENAVAYVRPYFEPGVVNLCPLFFEQNLTSQASVMMHEVRHFDGYSHVTCTRGTDIGSLGACDMDILDQGSYAISAQTLVAMARSSVTTAEEKPMIESEAIYTVFNRFNNLPKTKIDRSLILSNTSGEVYKWNVDGNSLELLATLAEAARVHVGFANNMTIYPVDTKVNAYRLDSTFKTSIPGIGLYANEYNALSPEERAEYQSITYLGVAGLLKNNVIASTCGNSAMTSLDVSASGNFTRILTLSTDEADSAYTSYLLSSTGEMHSYKCKEGATDALEIQKSELSVEPSLASIRDMTSLGGKIYVLTEGGKVAIVKNVNNQIQTATTALPFNNQNWVSISTMSQVEVFKK